VKECCTTLPSLMVSTTSTGWRPCELIFAVLERSARLEHDDAADEDIRVFDHASRTSNSNVLDAEAGRNIDDLVSVSVRRFETLFAKIQSDADRDRDTTSSVKMRCRRSPAVRTRLERRLGAGTISGSSAARGERGGLVAGAARRAEVNRTSAAVRGKLDSTVRSHCQHRLLIFCVARQLRVTRQAPLARPWTVAAAAGAERKIQDLA